MGKAVALFMALATLVHILKPLGLPGLKKRSDAWKIDRPDGYPLYEFESSRLTNRHTHGIVKTPGLIWGYNKTCCFGLMRFDTQGDSPQVTFECITIDGDVIHRHTLPASELGFD